MSKGLVTVDHVNTVYTWNVNSCFDANNGNNFNHQLDLQLSSVIIWASVVPKRTVAGSDRHFDNLCQSHFQSQSDFVSSVDGIYVSVD